MVPTVGIQSALAEGEEGTPTPAEETTVTELGSLADISSKTEGSYSYTLTSAVSLDSDITIAKNVSLVLNLDAYTLTGPSSTSGSATINNNGTLTINAGEGGAIVGQDTADYDLIANSSILTINGGDFSAVAEDLVYNTGNLSINGGAFAGSNKYAIYNSTHGHATISGGTFTNTGAQPTIANYATMNVTGGTFSKSVTDSLVFNNSKGTLTFDGDDIQVSKNVSGVTTPAIQSDGPLTINSGTYSNPNGEIVKVLGGGTLEVTGGTFTGSDTTNAAAITLGSQYNSTGEAIAATGTFSGCTITGTVGILAINSSTATIGEETIITASMYGLTNEVEPVSAETETATFTVNDGVIQGGYAAINAYVTSSVTVSGGTVITTGVNGETSYGTTAPIRVYGELPASDNVGTVAVSGGSFSDSVAEYTTENVNAELYSAAELNAAPYSYYADVEAAREASGCATDEIVDLTNLVQEEAVTYYTVVLDYSDDLHATETYTRKANEVVSLPMTMEKDGYTLDGWTDGTTVYKDTYTVPESTEAAEESATTVTLTPSWSPVTVDTPDEPSTPAGGTGATDETSGKTGWRIDPDTGEVDTTVPFPGSTGTAGTTGSTETGAPSEGAGSAGAVIDLSKKGKVALSKTTCTYSGKAVKPSVKVTCGKKTLKAGTDYTVTYRNNKKVGKATVTVKGKGAYTGTVTKTFKIVPKKTSVTKLSKASKSFTAKWKKVSGATGYQVRYSTSKSMKGAKVKTVKSSKTTSLKVAKLKSGKKYYVQVRTYKKVGGVNYWSGWSAPKAVIVKK